MISRTTRVFAAQGDPFLGALGGLIARGVGWIGKKIVGRGGAGAVKAVAQKAITPATRGAIARAAPRVAGAVGLGAAFGAGERALAPGQAMVEGQVVGRRRRRRGITATELRGFRKIAKLLHQVGMVPRGLRRGPHHHHS